MPTRKPVTTSSKISSAPNSSQSLRTSRLYSGVTDDGGGAAADTVQHQLAAQSAEFVGEDFLRVGGRALRDADGFTAAGAGHAHAVDHLVGPAMIIATDLDHPLAAGVGAGKTDGAHAGFGAGTEHAEHLDVRHVAVDDLGELDLVFVQQAGDGAAFVDDLVRLFTHGLIVGAEDGRAAGLQEVGVAVAVDIPHIGTVHAGGGNRERIVEGEIVLYAAGNDAARSL
jgi:hypothetical protein